MSPIAGAGAGAVTEGLGRDTTERGLRRQEWRGGEGAWARRNIMSDAGRSLKRSRI